jgi:hypothetical protein
MIMMKSLPMFLGLLVLFLLVIFSMPVLLIWSLNTLFPVLAIPYTIYTWAAAALLVAMFSSGNLKLAVKDTK